MCCVKRVTLGLWHQYAGGGAPVVPGPSSGSLRIFDPDATEALEEWASDPLGFEEERVDEGLESESGLIF